MRYSRIFLIEDDQDDQELFLLALGQIDPSVECTIHSNGKTALAALQNAVIPDLIFLDLNMPLMTGQEFMVALNKQDASVRSIPVIILSTSSDQTSIEESRSLGAENFITKPSNFKDLKSILKKIFV